MKKIIPALCMLLISAMLMGTSTYAWFSMNTQVTAKGMQVKAISDGGLAIASYTSGGSDPGPTDFANEAAALYAARAELYPTSFNGSNWFKATAADVNSYAAQTPTDGTKYTEVSGDDVANFRLCSKFQVKSLDQTEGKTYTLKVSGMSVTTSNGSMKTLDKALRVAIKVGNNYYYFAPNYTSIATNEFLKYVASTSTTGAYTQGKAAGNININSSNNVYDVAVYDSLDTTPLDVEIYIYYEGEDYNCASVNAIDIGELTVEVKFSSVANTTVS